MFYTVLSYLEYDIIYRKLTEMYKIDRLLMSLLALLSRPGFLCGSEKRYWTLERLYPARPPWGPAAVCRLASYPIRAILLDHEQ